MCIKKMLNPKKKKKKKKKNAQFIIPKVFSILSQKVLCGQCSCSIFHSYKFGVQAWDGYWTFLLLRYRWIHDTLV